MRNTAAGNMKRKPSTLLFCISDAMADGGLPDGTTDMASPLDLVWKPRRQRAAGAWSNVSRQTR